MNRKLIFLDIDGTITMPGNPPSAETAAALRKARENGHLIFMSTGRSAFNINKDVADIGFDGGLYNAGARIIVNNEEILSAALSPENLKEAMDLLIEADVTFHMESRDGLFSREAQGESAELDMSKTSTELQRQVEQKAIARTKPISAYAGEPVYKISFVTYSDAQREIIRKGLPDWAKLVWFSNFYSDVTVLAADISDKTVNKATAMEAICRYYGAAAEDCLSFGDSMNDAEITIAAGIGVAMGNSDENLKAIADRVCESCVDEGIPKEFKRMGLI